MFEVLIVVATSIMIVFLILNLFFRIKLLKLYRKLQEGKVDFPPSYILDRQKLLDEVVPKYPDYEQEILGLNKHLRISLGVAFIVFITALFIGYQYFKNRSGKTMEKRLIWGGTSR